MHGLKSTQKYRHICGCFSSTHAQNARIVWHTFMHCTHPYQCYIAKLRVKKSEAEGGQPTLLMWFKALVAAIDDLALQS